MAKINVEFDTATKELSVKMDGQAVADISSVAFYRDVYGDEERSCCEMTTRTEHTDDGYYSYTRICAKDGVAAKQAIADGVARAYAGSADFVQLPGKNPLQDELSTFLLSRKKRYA